MKTKISGSYMNYEITGNKNSSCLVVLHGIEGVTSYSRSQIRGLGKNFRVISIDLSDKNAHGAGSSRYGKIEEADQVRLLMETLDIENASFAGICADTVVYKYFNKMFPEMVDSVVDARPPLAVDYLTDFIIGITDKVFARGNYSWINHKFNAA